MYVDSENDSRTSMLADWFMRNALVLPVVVMASYYIGRGLGDSLQLLYLLCGLYALRGMTIRSDRTVITLLLLMLALFLIAVLYPDFSARSLKYWLLQALSGLVLIFTIGTAGANRQALDFRLLAWIPIALLLGLAIELAYFFFYLKIFKPAVQVNGMVLAALAPLVFFFRGAKKYTAVFYCALFFLLSFTVLILADSRTELLMLLVGAGLFIAIYTRNLSVLFVVLPVVIVITVIVDSYILRSQSLTMGSDIFQWFNRLSSNRLSIWREALSNPPENYLIGVGMRRSLEFLPQVAYVKHLHNLFIEIWFETGLLGLLGYLSLLTGLFWGAPRAYRSLEGMDRRIYAVFFASGMAALIGGLLDKGYLHPLTRYYMLFCFSVLYLYHRQCRKVDSAP